MKFHSCIIQEPHKPDLDRPLAFSAWWQNDKRPEQIAVDCLQIKAYGYRISVYFLRAKNDGKTPRVRRFQFIKS